MPIVPFDWNRLVWGEGNHDAVPTSSARWRAPIDSSSVMRNTELVTVPDAGQEIGLIGIVRRVGVFAFDYIHRECWPSIQHPHILSGEQDCSHVGIGSRIRTSILSSLLNGRNVLSDVQLRPKVDVVCSKTPIIDSRHSVIDANAHFVDDDWSRYKRDLLIGPYPRALALAHAVYRNFVCLVRLSNVEEQSDDREHFKESLPYFPTLLYFFLGLFLFGWGWFRWKGIYYHPDGLVGYILATIACVAGILIWWYGIPWSVAF